MRTGTITTTTATTVTWYRPDGSVHGEYPQSRGTLLYHGGEISAGEGVVSYPFAKGFFATVPANTVRIQS